MVYVDEIVKYPWARAPFKGGSCHMTADTLEELHELAQRIGLKREWFQAKSNVPHYDLTPSRRALAMEAGAVFKPGRQQARERLAARKAAQVLGGVDVQPADG